MSFRLTEPADADIDRILTETFELFGPNQLADYSGIIQRGLDRVGDEPYGIGTVARDDIAPRIRMFHLDHAARRRGGAAHSIYFLAPERDKEPVSVILRVLHERMEPRLRILNSLAVQGDDGRPLP